MRDNLSLSRITFTFALGALAPSLALAQNEEPAPAEEQPAAPVCPPGMEPGAQPPAPVMQPPVMEPSREAPAAPPMSPVAMRAPEPPYSPHQMALSVGGGPGNFIRERISDNSGTAGAWDVRLLVGTRSFIAGEAGYLGTAQSAHDPFNSRTIATTQLFGAARFNMTRRRIQPFVTAGLGWANLNRTGNPAESPVAASNFADSDNSLVVPFSGGIATYLGRHVTVDGRFNYHLITSKDFTPTGARPDMWIAELRAGYAF